MRLNGSLSPLAIVVLALTPVIAVAFFARAAPETGAGPAAQSPVAVVQVVQPEVRPDERSLRIPASLEGYFAADLYAKVSGYVSEVNVDIGSSVRAGETLLHIDVPEMVEELRQAEARLAALEAQVEAGEAKAVQAALAIKSAAAGARRATAELELRLVTCRRKEELYKGQAISDQELDEAQNQRAIAEAQVSIAEAAIESAKGEELVARASLVVARANVAVAKAEIARLKTLMDYATIVAPFDGVVTKRLADPGTFVRSAAAGAGTPLLRLARTDRLRLVMDVAEPEVPFVAVGTPVEVQVPALGGEPLRTAVARTAGGLDPSTRTMRVEVDVENTGGRLLPGMYAHAILRIVADRQAMVIPSAALRSRGKTTYVLVAEGEVAKEVEVVLARDDGAWAVVASGLAGGEQVITSATSAVAPGVAVAPVPFQGALARPRG